MAGRVPSFSQLIIHILSTPSCVATRFWYEPRLSRRLRKCCTGLYGWKRWPGWGGHLPRGGTGIHQWCLNPCSCAPTSDLSR